MAETDYLKKKPLEVTSQNDSGTTQDKAQPIVLAGFDAYDITKTTFTEAKDVSSEDSDPTGVTWNDDGTKMYVVGDNTFTVYEYTVSEAYDVGTASFSQNKDVSSEQTAVTGISWNDDGTKMYLAGVDTNDINEYNVSTAYDISTASFSQSKDISNEDTTALGVSWNNDGTKMYVVGGANDDILEYNVSTAYDVTTASFSQSKDIASEDAEALGMSWNDDGTKMYMIGAENDNVYEYNLSTAFDISTASFSQVKDVAGEDTLPRGMAWNDNGAKMYVAGSDTARIIEYGIESDSETGTGDIVLDWTNISSASDIAVYDSNGNLLPYEIESFDATAETATLWAYNSWTRDDTVQASVVYGDGPASSEENVTGTWSNTGQNAVMVQHLQDDPLTATDSTSNNNDGTVNGAVSTTGQFDGAGSFDGTDDTIDFSTYTTPTDSGNSTIAISGWYYLDQLASNKGSTQTFFRWGSSGIQIYQRNLNPDDELAFNAAGINQQLFGTIPAQEWLHIVVVLKNTGTQNSYDLEIFLNGQSLGTSQDLSLSFDYTHLKIGDNFSQEDYLQGDTDEFKVFNSSISQEDIQAEYDASPKAGQVYFSQQSAETTQDTNLGPTATASATGAGETISITGSTTADTTTSTATATGNTIFIEPDFGTLDATSTGAGATISISGGSTLNTSTANAAGTGGTSQLTLILDTTKASATGTGETTDLDRLSGVVTVEDQLSSNVDVNVVDKTNNVLYETTSNADGEWAVDSGDGILYQVAYLFDDGSTFYGDAEQSDTT